MKKILFALAFLIILAESAYAGSNGILTQSISSGGSNYTGSSPIVITGTAIGCPTCATNAGVTLGTSTSVAAPYVTGDTTTGLYSAATSTISAAVAGANILTIGSSGLNLASGKTLQINGSAYAASNLSNGTTGSGSVVLGTTPTITLNNGTGLPVSTGISGLGTGVATFLATPSSANLLSALTTNTGSGVAVFGTTPTFTTSIIDPLVIGGTGTAGSLIMESTSGSGATDFISFKTGSQAEAMRITTTGSVSIGTSIPVAGNILTVKGSSAIAPNVVVTTQSATPAINQTNANGVVFSITALAQAVTSMSSGLSGTPVNGSIMEIQFTDNGTARAITWGSSFGSSTVTLPTTTVTSTLLHVFLQYDSASSLWICIGVA